MPLFNLSSRPPALHASKLFMSDAQIQHVYAVIKQEYNQNKQSGITHEEIAVKLKDTFKTLGNYAFGFYLDDKGNAEAKLILDTFLNAQPKSISARLTPLYSTFSPVRSMFASHSSSRQYQTVNYQHIYIERQSPSLFDWLFLAAYINSHRSPSQLPPPMPEPTPRSNKSENDKKAELYACLAVSGIVLGAAISGGIAFAYLIKQSVDNIERFVWSEGWLEAVGSFAAMIGSGAASFILADAFVSMPIIQLAISAGLSSPAGCAVFAVMSISFIGAALGTMAFHWLYHAQTNANAIDSLDPYRFTLTSAEDKYLVSKFIDPLKVRCAIIALREEIKTKEVPSLMYRSWFSPKEVQQSLDKIRQLLRGELPEVKVGDLTFNCLKSQTFNFYNQVSEINEQMPAVRNTGGRTPVAPLYVAVPSAPPSEDQATVDDPTNEDMYLKFANSI